MTWPRERGRGPDKALGLIRRAGLLLRGEGGFHPAVEQRLVGFDPAINVAVNVGFEAWPSCIIAFSALMSAIGSFMMLNRVAAAGFFSAQALLATMCMVFTGKP